MRGGGGRNSVDLIPHQPKDKNPVWGEMQLLTLSLPILFKN